MRIIIKTLCLLLFLTLLSLPSFSQFNEWQSYRILEDFDARRTLVYKTDSPKIPFGPVSNPHSDDINPSNYVGKLVFKKNSEGVSRNTTFKVVSKCNKGRALTCPINFRDNPKISIDTYTEHYVGIYVAYIDEGLANSMGNDGVITIIKKWIDPKRIFPNGQKPTWVRTEFDFSDFSFYEPMGFTKISIIMLPRPKDGVDATEVYFDNIRQFRPKK